MTDAMEKVLLGLKGTEIIKPTEGPSPLNDEALSKYFEASHRPIVFAPFSTMGFKKKKEEEQKPTEPTS
ncbi:hypothetical protein P4555_11535 [Peribacillus frigoritolerans]|uniref:hypothetical protein n=1 Tax=Peribacillus frigoritolerans TaxID=450367 RepID=UPI002E1B6FDB|nr:hypothetical protein [Peribacillus frigoritolerans]